MIAAVTRRFALLLFVLLSTGTTLLAQKLSISQKNVPLNKVFTIIQQQSGYSLLYDNQLLKQAKNITIEVKDASLEEVLDHCLKDLPLTYVITGKIIVIKEKIQAEQKIVASLQNITGVVKDEHNNYVSGASVIIKETNNGTQTTADGCFAFTGIAPGTYTIEVSFVGYSTEQQTFNVGNESTALSIKLKLIELGLQEITVATALGITKRSSALTYSTQAVANDELSTVKNTNVLNSLNGKVAGMQVNRTSSGAGGSVRVVLRGDKSTRSSQPLYVIDGIPIINPTGGPDAGLYNSSPDGGDILSTFNPDDIESINVLKGASASVLYGSLGSNGVILISTKKGKQGQSRINFSSSISFDRATLLPSLQFDYAQSTPQTSTNPGSEDSWGAKGATLPDKNYVKDFFQTGITFINSVNFSSGNSVSSNYFSYSNTDNKGIIPDSRLTQHTLNFHQNAKLLNDKLTLDANLLGSIQNIHNRPMPGVYFNPLTGLYLFPRGLDFSNYKEYEYFSPSRYLYAQNWWNIHYDKNQANGGGWLGQDYQQNPYWIVNRNAIDNRNQTMYASALLKYELASSISIQARGNISNFSAENHRRIHASTQPTLSYFNGRYNQSRTNNTTLYGDLLVTGKKTIRYDLVLDFTAGASIQQQRGKTLSTDGQPTVANVFLESALDRNTIIIQNSAFRKQIQSLFANVQLAYQNKFFLELSNRNDWS
ncbi:MAG TPA: carboxypeptidase-like regulatory domain-containing protein, partial [Chitinophagaceae bacterium]